MDPSRTQYHELEMNPQTLGTMLVCTKTQQEKKPKPPDQEALKCPRCESTNTKFCYYNNYSLSQPRYFCKSCRRYWTKGGTLRNVPVGGGCRKNKRPSSSTSSKRSQDQPLITASPTPLSSLTPLSSYDSNDLTLAFAGLRKHATAQSGFDSDLSLLAQTNDNHCDFIGNSGITTSSTAPAFLDALRSGFLEIPTGFHNVHYGNFGNGQMGYLKNGGIGVNVSEEMTIPYGDTSSGTTTATAVTTVKQEFYNGRESVLWGFPWQLGGNVSMGDVDSGRQSWNGLGSSWHGLLYSSLM